MHRPRTPLSRFHPAPITLAAIICLCGGALHTPDAFGAEVSVAITAQPLAQALNELARQSGLTLVVSPALVAGKTAPAVSGRLTPQEAFARLLSGSGLSADIDGQAVTIRPQHAPKASDAALPAVTVSAKAERSATTEQTGSYTTRALTIGKMVQSIRETPQSVTVVTRQQMDDTNVTTLEDVLAQSTGSTKSQRNFGAHVYVMRGFEIPDNNYLIDGVSGTVYNAVGWAPLDMAIFDRVEVLRGAGGLIAGAGDPSGVVNMVRKRPRADRHLDITLSAGSWSNYRTEIDAGSPLNDAGTVRGRFVAAYQDREFFYDVAHSKEPLLYGVIDADLGRNTKLTVGLRHQETNIDGYTIFGLPRFSNGAALDVSRSTYLSQRWNRHEARVDDLFVELEHQLNDDWKAKLTLNHSKTEVEQKLGTMRGAVNPTTLAGTTFNSFYFMNRQVDSSGVDANITGSFSAWGGTHQVMAGANWARSDSPDKSTMITSGLGFPIDIYNPDHAIVPEPTQPGWDDIYKDTKEVSAVYASARLQLAEPLHLLVGGRVSWYSYKFVNELTSTRLQDYQQNGQFTPYAGLVYDLDKQWSVYTSYADTFQPQTQYKSASGGPLKPAIGSNIEAGIKGELYNGRLNVSAAVFSIRKKNVAVWDEANSNLGLCPSLDGSDDCYRNASLLRSKGFELEATGQITAGWEVAAGYTNLRSRDDAGESISAESPRHLLRATTFYRLPGAWSQWSVGGGVSAQSGYSYNESPGVEIAEGGRAVWDLRGAYRIDKTWTASLNIANVTDKRYWANLGGTRGGNYFGTPRNLTLTLRGSF